MGCPVPHEGESSDDLAGRLRRHIPCIRSAAATKMLMQREYPLKHLEKWRQVVPHMPGNACLLAITPNPCPWFGPH